MHTYLPTYLPTYVHTDRQTDRPTDIQTDRQTDRQTYRHTDIRIDSLSLSLSMISSWVTRSHGWYSLGSQFSSQLMSQKTNWFVQPFKCFEFDVGSCGTPHEPSAKPVQQVFGRLASIRGLCHLNPPKNCSWRSFIFLLIPSKGLFSLGITGGFSGLLVRRGQCSHRWCLAEKNSWSCNERPVELCFGDGSGDFTNPTYPYLPTPQSVAGPQIKV